MKSDCTIRWSWFVLAIFVSANVIACKVPVFRYALERWPTDSYRMVAIVDDTKSADVSRALAAIGKLHSSAANLEAETIHLGDLSEAELWQLEGFDGTDSVPALQVFFPERDGQRKLCWSGELIERNVLAWGDSSTRQQIVSDLQSGVSAVWVLVEGDDAKENTRIHNDLIAALKQATEEITIPAGVIARSDAAQYMQEHPGASMDDVLRSDIPLRIEFSIQTVSPAGSDWALLAMVNRWSQAYAEAADVPRPYVFPVFGRGRMIEPLSAERFNSSNVIGACKYLVGECSCTVKSQNPGVDLLLCTSWQEQLGEQIVMISPTELAEPTALSIPPGREPASDAALSSKGLGAIAIALLMLVVGWVIAFRTSMLKRN